MAPGKKKRGATKRVVKRKVAISGSFVVKPGQKPPTTYLQPPASVPVTKPFTTQQVTKYVKFLRNHPH